MRDCVLPREPDGLAPDGSAFRRLLAGRRGQLGHFELPAGSVSSPVVHRSVEEIWYVLSGSGELWRSRGDQARMVALEPGTCADVATGTAFQFRANTYAPLRLLIVTMPVWPGDDEAQPCAGHWPV